MCHSERSEESLRRPSVNSVKNLCRFFAALLLRMTDSGVVPGTLFLWNSKRLALFGIDMALSDCYKLLF